MTGTYVTDSQFNQTTGNVAPLFMDTCQRLAYTVPADPSGYNDATYPVSISLPCLFDGRPSQDVQTGTDVPMSDATVYLARGTVLMPDDRIRVTHIHGLAILNPLTYRIVAGPTVDYFAMTAKLKLITE